MNYPEPQGSCWDSIEKMLVAPNSVFDDVAYRGKSDVNAWDEWRKETINDRMLPARLPVPQPPRCECRFQFPHSSRWSA